LRSHDGDKESVEKFQVACINRPDQVISVSLNGDINLWSGDATAQEEGALPSQIVTGHQVKLIFLTLSECDSKDGIYRRR
jgi:hypothetical protein